MTRMKKVLLACLTVLGVHAWGAAASAQTYVSLAHGVKAVLYKPQSASHVGVIIIHRTSNYLSHAGCTNLSQRGITVLCMNSRFDNNETLVNFELIAQDVGAGVSYLKNTVGVTKVVLFGHSGGGPTTTYYQAVAENGPTFCQGPNKLSQCASSGADSVAGLIPADGIVLADAHPSNAVNFLRTMNPSVRPGQDKQVVGVSGENGPITAVPNLDPWSPANGFVANGASHYSKAFQLRYSRAQSERMNAWIDEALHIKSEIQQGNWRFPDDDAIIIARGGASSAGGGSEAALFRGDPTIMCCTSQPEQVLKNDGSVVTQMYTSPRLPTIDYPGNLSFDDGTKDLTVTSFLSANAIRSTDAMDFNQIDWCSSNTATPCNLQHISVPLLITGMGAYYFFVDGEKYLTTYAHSADKSFIIADGLVHGITACSGCPGGPYNNMVTNYWNYVANWITARFGT